MVLLESGNDHQDSQLSFPCDAAACKSAKQGGAARILAALCLKLRLSKDSVFFLFFLLCLLLCFLFLACAEFEKVNEGKTKTVKQLENWSQQAQKPVAAKASVPPKKKAVESRDWLQTARKERAVSLLEAKPIAFLVCF